MQSKQLYLIFQFASGDLGLCHLVFHLQIPDRIFLYINLHSLQKILFVLLLLKKVYSWHWLQFNRSKYEHLNFKAFKRDTRPLILSRSGVTQDLGKKKLFVVVFSLKFFFENSGALRIISFCLKVEKNPQNCMS